MGFFFWQKTLIGICHLPEYSFFFPALGVTVNMPLKFTWKYFGRMFKSEPSSPSLTLLPTLQAATLPQSFFPSRPTSTRPPAFRFLRQIVPVNLSAQTFHSHYFSTLGTQTAFKKPLKPKHTLFPLTSHKFQNRLPFDYTNKFSSF